MAGDESEVDKLKGTLIKKTLVGLLEGYMMMFFFCNTVDDFVGNKVGESVNNQVGDSDDNRVWDFVNTLGDSVGTFFCVT